MIAERNPWCVSVFAFVFALALFIPARRAKTLDHSTQTGSELNPQPAIPAILSAFDKYEVVAMPEAHGDKDLDDFILSLIRNPAFAEKVNDIAVECGNSLYQPILDRYIAGEDVPFADVQKVWRNTTQPMCGVSGFFEELFPLVRAINQKLPPGRRLRVIACDPPIDWDQVKTIQEYLKFSGRDASIASVMEKNVLSQHRKALMLFGVVHLMHGVAVPAPGKSELQAGLRFPAAKTDGGSCGRLPLRRSWRLRLAEPIPADVALDTNYMSKWLWRSALITPPLRTLNDFDQQTVSGAANALLPVMPDINSIIHSVIQGCLDHKDHSNDLQ